MATTVTLNASPIRALIRQRIDRALDRLPGPIPHDNHDYTWRPAKWDIDRARTRRHTMATTAAITRTPTGIAVTLTYAVADAE